MNLNDILRNKGNEVYAIRPDATLQEVVDMLVQHNCGSLVVLDNDRICGIITERDILRAAARTVPPLSQHYVREHMTVDVLVAAPTEPIGDVMGLMTEQRIRHLPVVKDDRLIGIVSIGDIVKAQHHQLSVENHYLKNYIQS